MSASYVGHFQVIPRGRRAKPAIRRIRRSSKIFKAQLARGDEVGMRMTSEAAWNSLASLFEILRNEEDHGNLARSYMTAPTGVIADGLTQEEQNAMIAERKVDRSHPAVSALGLRDALNKIAHFKTAVATFRVDQRGAHYLVLGGRFRNRRWVAEILVSRLCRNASIAANAITGF